MFFTQALCVKETAPIIGILKATDERKEYILLTFGLIV